MLFVANVIRKASWISVYYTVLFIPFRLSMIERYFCVVRARVETKIHLEGGSLNLLLQCVVWANSFVTISDEEKFCWWRILFKNGLFCQVCLKYIFNYCILSNYYNLKHKIALFESIWSIRPCHIHTIFWSICIYCLCASLTLGA